MTGKGAMRMTSMRNFMLLLIALVTIAAAPVPDGATMIRGARVFDGKIVRAPRDILIRGERIVAIGRKLKLPSDARVIDARGLTLLPGLHDLHVHTASVAFESPQAITRGYAAYLAAGITTVNEYSVSGPMLTGIRTLTAVARAPHLNLAARLGVPHGHGTESPFTNSITLQVTTPAEAHAAMTRALSYHPDVIKVFADGWRYGRDTDRPSMDLPTLAAIVGDAHRARIRVVTHTVTLAGAKIAAAAGVDALVHGIGDAPVDRALIRLMRRNGTGYVPTLVAFEPQQARIFSPEQWRMLSPADRARETARMARPPAPVPAYEARRWAIMRANAMRLKAAGIRIGIGSDAGVGGVYHGWATLREIELLTGLGWSPAEALTAATWTSARIMRQQRDHGWIARGQRADVLLTGGRPDMRIGDLYDVRRVFVAGVEIAVPEMIALRDTAVLPPVPEVRPGDRPE